ncbi:MAG TPA: hypothetical protein VFE23_06385 [Usitatibacter sp.]|jgi:hypothetical protein|nr:hypothetical protein [Usitatibacter sp.]
MNKTIRIAVACALGAMMAAALPAAAEKNWKAPDQAIYGQKLADDTMKKHPELLSITLHGVPPGENDKYTMFAGSYHDRVGNADDPDDIDVQKKGITILDPRWHRTKDTDKKFVVLMPMRDKANENIGLVVYAFKNPKLSGSKQEVHYLQESIKLRDELAKKIPSYDALFQPAK